MVEYDCSGDRRTWQNNLYGALPGAWNITSLVTLYLDSNMLNGTIPSSWSTMTSLRDLRLDGNSLSGTLPSSWSTMTSLQQLVMNSNKLSGSLPSSWSRIKSLGTLQLSSNDLSGSLPTSWSTMTSLQQLVMNSNKLSGSLPSSWSNLASLRYINLNDNLLHGGLPASWINLTQINHLQLDVENNCLSGDVSSFLPNVTLEICGTKLQPTSSTCSERSWPLACGTTTHSRSRSHVTLTECVSLSPTVSARSTTLAPSKDSFSHLSVSLWTQSHSSSMSSRSSSLSWTETTFSVSRATSTLTFTSLSTSHTHLTTSNIAWHQTASSSHVGFSFSRERSATESAVVAAAAASKGNTVAASAATTAAIVSIMSGAGDPSQSMSLVILALLECSKNPPVSVGTYFISVFFGLGNIAMSLGNVGLAVMVGLLHAIIARLLRSLQTVGPSDDPWLYLEHAYFPGWTIKLQNILFPGSTVGGVAGAVASASSSETASCIIALVLVAAFIAVQIWIQQRVVLSRATFVPYTTYSVGLLLERRFLFPSARWESAAVRRAFIPLIGTMKIGYSLLSMADLLLACCVGAVSGAYLGGGGGCV